MKRLALILALALCAFPAFAQNVKIYVVQDGGGVIERPGNVTPQEAAVILGDNAPPAGATGIVIERGKPARWTDLTPAQVNAEFGGNGDPVIELFPAEDDPQTPIEIFPEGDFEDTGDGIVLNAGNWSGNITNQTTSGCPAGTEDAVNGMIADLNGSIIQGTIDATFTPARMYPQFNWTKTGTNNWRGELSIGDNGIGSRVQSIVSIRSPDLIQMVQQVNITGLGNCASRTEVDLVRRN